MPSPVITSDYPLHPNLGVLTENYTVPINSSLAFVNSITLNSNVSMTIPSTSAIEVLCSDVDGGTSISPATVIVPALFTTSSASAVNITGLTYNLLAGGIYEIEVLLMGTVTEGSGIQVGIAYSGTATGRALNYFNTSSTAQGIQAFAIPGLSGNSFWLTINTDLMGYLRSYLRPSTNGTVTIQVLKSSAGSVSIYAGSRMTITELA